MTAIPERAITAVAEALDLGSRAEAEQITQKLDAAGLLRRPPRGPVPEHGTRSAYERCRRRPEGACDACKKANRTYVQAWLDRRDPDRERRRKLTAIEREWKRLTDSQRKALVAVVRDGRDPQDLARSGELASNAGLLTARALERRGLMRGYRTPTERGVELARWAIRAGAEKTTA